MGPVRTIHFQNTTIWKIPRDLCHILWRLFTIARQFPTFWRQFVVIGNTSLSLTEYWRNRQRKFFETNNFRKGDFANIYTLSWAYHFFRVLFFGKLLSKFSRIRHCWFDVSRRPCPTGICWLMCVPPPSSPPARASWLEYCQVTRASCWPSQVSQVALVSLVSGTRPMLRRWTDRLLAIIETALGVMLIFDQKLRGSRMAYLKKSKNRWWSAIAALLSS